MNVFAYLDYCNNPMVAWEIAIGRIQSIYKTEHKYGISMWLYGRLQRFSNDNEDEYVLNEFELELFRRKYYPRCNSRLSSLFFFETYGEALCGIKSMGFDESEDFISEVYIEPISYVKLDSNWITYCLGQSQDNKWMDKYWSGCPYPDQEPNWELLVDGFGLVYNNDLRERAYKYIYKYFQDSTPLLSIAICIFSYTCDFPEVALMLPYIYLCDNTLKGDFLINMNDFNNRESEMSKALYNYLQYEQMPSFKLPMNKDTFFIIPDLRIEHFEINLKEPNSKIINELIGLK